MSDAVDRSKLLAKLLEKIEEMVSAPGPVSEKLLGTCDMLRSMVPHYDWVGFYLVDRVKKNELVLGPFAGEPTVHVRIPFGEGICGQAAEKGDTFIVQDVSKQSNYLACSIHVKSEIVVPIFKNDEVIGELDIDSHQVDCFTDNDKEFLERVAAVVVRLL